MKTVSMLREEIESDAFREKILDIYVDKDLINYESERIINALDTFEETFGDGPCHIMSAPGRTEVCGNHTDHQRGEVLAASINRDILGIVRKEDDNSVTVLSEGYTPMKFSLDEIDKSFCKPNKTVSLIKGVINTLKEMGYKIGGFSTYLTSDVIAGAGLSSSAAFETMIGTIISYLYNDGAISAVTIGKVGQIAENEYFGKPCGLMDQMASSVGGLIHIDFKDKENPIVDKIPFPLNKNGYVLCITDTKGSHANLTPDYAAIRNEMEGAAALFGKEVLSEVSEDELIKNIPLIREKVNDRAALRVIHYVTECRRVREAIKALNDNDIDSFLKIENEAGDSSFKCLQNIYSPSSPTVQGITIGLATSKLFLGDDFYGRVQGGGFAGTIQAFVKAERANAYREYMDEIFGEGSCNILQIRPYGGIQII